MHACCRKRDCQNRPRVSIETQCYWNLSDLKCVVRNGKNEEHGLLLYNSAIYIFSIRHFLRNQPSKNYLQHGTEFRFLELQGDSFFYSTCWYEMYKLETVLPDTTLYTGTNMERRHKNLEYFIDFLPSSAKTSNSIPVFHTHTECQCLVTASWKSAW